MSCFMLRISYNLIGSTSWTQCYKNLSWIKTSSSVFDQYTYPKMFKKMVFWWSIFTTTMYLKIKFFFKYGPTMASFWSIHCKAYNNNDNRPTLNRNVSHLWWNNFAYWAYLSTQQGVLGRLALASWLNKVERLPSSRRQLSTGCPLVWSSTLVWKLTLPETTILKCHSGGSVVITVADNWGVLDLNPVLLRLTHTSVKV